MHMHALAFGTKCGSRAARGLEAGAASSPSSRSRDARAARPMPLAEVARKLRRLWRACSSAGLMGRKSLRARAGFGGVFLLYQFAWRNERHCNEAQRAAGLIPAVGT